MLFKFFYEWIRIHILITSKAQHFKADLMISWSIKLSMSFITHNIYQKTNKKRGLDLYIETIITDCSVNKVSTNIIENKTDCLQVRLIQ